MDSNLPLSFREFPEDVQLCILSFLHRSDLSAFASTCKKYFHLCADDRLWFLRCSRRWGSRTQIKKWGGGKVSYMNLFRLLDQYEDLIGFWRYSYFRRQSPPQMALFEWGPFYITGYRVLQSKQGYDVVKKPFLWLTATSDGKTLSYLDMNETLSLTDKDLSCGHSEKLRSAAGLILVNIDLCENGVLSLREDRQYLEFRKRVQTPNRREVYDAVYRSPPDKLMSQIFKILESKVSVTDYPKQGRKERQPRQQQRVCRWRTQQFIKIMNPSPTPSRPLQGLWKGIDHNKCLNLYLVSYWNRICCEVVGSYSTQFSTSNCRTFTARATAFLESPLSSEEEHTFYTRRHLRPVARSNQDRYEDFDVLRVFHTLSPYQGYDGQEDVNGRLWLYANGTFGFGFLRDDYIIDMKPLLKNGCLADVTTKSS
ncbi:F-box protein [Dorcoceras hygrometricum]|uniref:F-box protein n=1 Tax=Dorcoceras hygrometricum TaxID=472368 RepID=A0A2Z7CDJ4_9LAMI|nr:F-box protein [Dorcoceras hygrometricum]